MIGTDSPSLPCHLVAQAFGALGDSDVVLGPAADGGYYLIGVTRPHPGLFQGIQWSTSVVLSQTVARCRELGLRLATLPVWYDIDEIDDLHFLRGHAAALTQSGQPCPCPSTRELLPELLADGTDAA